jgi:hypothetical protein
MQRILFVLGIGLVVVGALQAQGTGYRLTSNQIVVDGPQHWRNWNFPVGTLEIDETGTITPFFLRRNTNATEDIIDFLRLHPPNKLDKEPEDITLTDAIRAGSNALGVLSVLDGDMSTYWQPDPPESEVELGTQWWFTVDLGRLVIAKRIVLKFVEEDAGDPFLQYDVLISDGEVPEKFVSSDEPAFNAIWRTLKPNKTERLLEISLGGTQEAEAEELSSQPLNAPPTSSVAVVQQEFAGTGVRLVQVVVRASDFARGRVVSQDAYGALSATEQGDIVFHKLQRDGRLTEVAAEDYDTLPADQQGDVVFYQRERPRLAELEVWHEGDDAILATLARGGDVSASQGLPVGRTVDGNVQTYVDLIYSFDRQTIRSPEGHITYDLGSAYWLDTFRIAYGGQTLRDRFSFPSYRLDASNGAINADGTLKWTTVASREQSSSRKAFEGHDFELIKTRFFRMVFEHLIVPVGGHRGFPASVQLYGQGFQPEVQLESDLIGLDGRRNLLSIEWDADTPPGTNVLIQTRTGNELGEVLHFFKSDGTEISKTEYNNPTLLDIFKGDIVPEEVEGDDWSGWSAPYEDMAGSSITSPSPRAFLKVQATMLSEDPAISATLKSLKLNFAEPVAQGLMGEVTPFRVDSLGVERVFSLYVRPEFGNRDPGFDQMLLVTPSDMPLEFMGLYAGSDEDFAGAADMASLSVADVEVVATATDSLQLAFTAVRPGDGIEVVRLDFRTTLFGMGAVLQAALQNSADGGDAWQRVDPGDALAEVEGNTITLVGNATRGDLLTEVSVRPRVFTPNGDRINDETVFAFKVVRLSDDSPVEVTIYDLSGRVVRRLVERRAVSTGEYAIGWDGKDASGGLVPPGIYYARLRLAVDKGGISTSKTEVLRMVSVAY